MQLVDISIVQFKNHLNSNYRFDRKAICIYGYNGCGKTNLLDAIYTTVVSKSFLNSKDQQLIHIGQDFFRISCQFSSPQSDLNITIKYKYKSKHIEVNNVKLSKLNQIFGTIPLVVCAPQDIQLITGLSEERRKWIDYSLSTVYPQYLQDLMLYSKVLEHRNAWLKLEEYAQDTVTLESLNIQLHQLAVRLYPMRKQFMDEIVPFINHWYSYLSSDADSINIQYASDLHSQSTIEWLHSSLTKDKVLKRTTHGIHKDDLIMTLSEQELKKSGSQGQQKSYLYAMKLAQAQWISYKTKKKSIFLLDDFSDKLDQTRIHKLQEIINTVDFVSQWFITDTDTTHFEEIKDKQLIAL